MCDLTHLEIFVGSVGLAGVTGCANHRCGFFGNVAVTLLFFLDKLLYKEWDFP